MPSMPHRQHTDSVRRDTSLSERRFGAVVLHEPGQPEVQDLHEPIARDHDVLGLQVAVDDAVLVRALECVPDLNQIRETLILRARLVAQRVSQPHPVDALHRQVAGRTDFSRLVDGGDAGVIHARRGLRLENEARLQRAGQGVLGEDLQGDVSIETGIRTLCTRRSCHPSRDGL